MASWSIMKRTISISSLSRPGGPSLKTVPSACGLKMEEQDRPAREKGVGD